MSIPTLPQDEAGFEADSEGPYTFDQSLEKSIMSVIGFVIVTVISGFALYRWHTGDTVGAAVNSLIVVTTACTLALGRAARFSAMALKLFGCTTSAACILSSLFVGSNGLLWALLALLVNVLILSRTWALSLNSVIIAVLAFSPQLFVSVLQQVSWVIVATLITLFATTSMNLLRQQRQQLARQANIDPLTGAGNRRLMRMHLQAYVSGRRQAKHTATLLVLDLDRFKDINDRHGHDTGDRVLREFAECVQSSMRADDGFYRMGGEEFVVLLRDMDEAVAHDYLPRFHKQLSGQVRTASGPVEFSAGAAVFSNDDSWSDWLARADKALYLAKEAGRNQLRF